MTAGPLGVVHVSVSCVEDEAATTKLVGGFGAPVVVCPGDASFDGLLVPPEEIADTRYQYVLPDDNPEREKKVLELPVFELIVE